MTECMTMQRMTSSLSLMAGAGASSCLMSPLLQASIVYRQPEVS